PHARPTGPTPHFPFHNPGGRLVSSRRGRPEIPYLDTAFAADPVPPVRCRPGEIPRSAREATVKALVARMHTSARVAPVSHREPAAAVPVSEPDDSGTQGALEPRSPPAMVSVKTGPVAV